MLNARNQKSIDALAEEDEAGTTDPTPIVPA